jgi:hypothetical protein
MHPDLTPSFDYLLPELKQITVRKNFHEIEKLVTRWLIIEDMD